MVLKLNQLEEDKSSSLSRFDNPVLTMIPVIDMGEFRHVLSLPLPTIKNTFGFRWYHPDTYIYSPIDLTVAVTEWTYLNSLKTVNLKIIKDLKEFFDSNQVRLSESKVYIGITNDSGFFIKSIAYYKSLLVLLKSKGNLELFDKYKRLLKRNAPLTFKS